MLTNFGLNGRGIFRVGVVDDVRSFETSQRTLKTESGIKSYGQNGEGRRAVFSTGTSRIFRSGRNIRFELGGISGPGQISGFGGQNFRSGKFFLLIPTGISGPGEISGFRGQNIRSGSKLFVRDAILAEICDLNHQIEGEISGIWPWERKGR